jgi:hypothetical protein
MASSSRSPTAIGPEVLAMAEGVVTMAAYRLLSEIVATGDDPTFPRMAELPKIVFSKT